MFRPNIQRRAATMATLLTTVGCWAQTSQPTKEYIRLNGRVVAIENPAAAQSLTLAPNLVTVGGVASNATFTVTASGAPAWNATSDSTGWLTVGMPASGGNGVTSVPYFFAQNLTGAARTGKITVTSGALSPQTLTVTQTPLPSTPLPPTTSITPVTGSGTGPQVFTFTGASQNGNGFITDASFIMNWAVDGVSACYVWYNQTYKLLFLLNDAGNGWLGGVQPGSAVAAISNGQCTLDVAHTAVTFPDIYTVAVSVPITFDPSFIGPQYLFSIAYDSSQPNAQNSGWVWSGQTYTAVSAPTTALPTVTVSPPSAALTNAAETLSFQISDGNGFPYFEQLYVNMNSSAAQTNSCYFSYLRGVNLLFLADDNGNFTNPPQAPGTGSTVSNGQCGLNIGGSTLVDESPATLYAKTLNIPVTLLGTYAGGGVQVQTVDHARAVSPWTTTVTWNLGQIQEQITTPSVSGASSGAVGVSYTYTSSVATSNLGNAVQYQFSWGDQTAPSAWSSSITAQHAWSAAGSYSVSVRARSQANTAILSQPSAALGVTITQSVTPTITLMPSSNSVGNDTTMQSSFSFTVSAAPNISWSVAADSVNWLAITFPSSRTGTGTGMVAYSVQSNTMNSVNPRSANITVTATNDNSIAPAVFTVTQDRPIQTGLVEIPSGLTSLYGGQSVSFQANFNVSSNSAVKWSASPSNIGGFISSGITATYTAPATISASSVVTIKATSQFDSSQSAFVTINLVPTTGPFVYLSPSAVTTTPVQQSGTQFFAQADGDATLTAGIAWSIFPSSAGTISTTGLYRPPSGAIGAPIQGVVTASSPGAGSAESTVTVNPTAPNYVAFQAGNPTSVFSGSSISLSAAMSPSSGSFACTDPSGQNLLTFASGTGGCTATGNSLNWSNVQVLLGDTASNYQTDQTTIQVFPPTPAVDYVSPVSPFQIWQNQLFQVELSDSAGADITCANTNCDYTSFNLGFTRFQSDQIYDGCGFYIYPYAKGSLALTYESSTGQVTTVPTQLKMEKRAYPLS